MSTSTGTISPQSPATERRLDTAQLEAQVKTMYREVADHPDAEFHFETGRDLAERLGYPAADLDRIPQAAIASFAGVGHHLDYAAITPGDVVLDLGSGSGMDSFIAALHTGPDGRVIGVDMTDAQLAKSRALARSAGFDHVSFREGYIEDLPVESGSVDRVITNGVINLSPDKGRVFREVARVLRPGGLLALADIVTKVQMPERIICDASLWAACIGGAMHRETYQQAIADAGLEVVVMGENHAYRFLSGRATGAADSYGVTSISLMARKP